MSIYATIKLYNVHTLVSNIGSYFLHVNKLTLDDENEDSEMAACSMDPSSDSTCKSPHFSVMYTHTHMYMYRPMYLKYSTKNTSNLLYKNVICFHCFIIHTSGFYDSNMQYN